MIKFRIKIKNHLGEYLSETMELPLNEYDIFRYEFTDFSSYEMKTSTEGKAIFHRYLLIRSIIIFTEE